MKACRGEEHWMAFRYVSAISIHKQKFKRLNEQAAIEERTLQCSLLLGVVSSVDPIRIISGGQIRIANTSGLEKESGCMAHPQNWDITLSRGVIRCPQNLVYGYV